MNIDPGWFQCQRTMVHPAGPSVTAQAGEQNQYYYQPVVIMEKDISLSHLNQKLSEKAECGSEFCTGTRQLQIFRYPVLQNNLSL